MKNKEEMKKKIEEVRAVVEEYNNDIAKSFQRSILNIEEDEEEEEIIIGIISYTKKIIIGIKCVNDYGYTKIISPSCNKWYEHNEEDIYNIKILTNGDFKYVFNTYIEYIKETEETIEEINKVRNVVKEYNNYLAERYINNIEDEKSILIGNTNGKKDIIFCDKKHIPNGFKIDIKIDNGDFETIINKYIEYFKK